MLRKTSDQPDFSRSVRFRFDRTLGHSFIELGFWLGGLVLRSAKKEGRLRPNTPRQIYDAADCILANFIEAHRKSTNCFVAIPLSEAVYTKSDYFKRDFGYTNFVRVLDFLKSHDPPLVVFKDGFIDYETKHGRVSRFIPSQPFLDLLNGYVHLSVLPKSGANPNLMHEALAYSKSHPFKQIPIPPSATRYREAADCIRLKDSEKRLIRLPKTAEIADMRKELEKWNDFLEKNHLVDLLLPDKEIERLYAKEDVDAELEAFWNDERDRPKFVELERVRLYRVFNNGSFDEGGRFYGGWWQQVPGDKRKFITINGRTTFEYDYSYLHPAMLYAELGLPLADDAYEIEGIEKTNTASSSKPRFSNL
jgi:hypothetical protein